MYEFIGLIIRSSLAKQGIIEGLRAYLEYFLALCYLAELEVKTKLDVWNLNSLTLGSTLGIFFLLK